MINANPGTPVNNAVLNAEEMFVFSGGIANNTTVNEDSYVFVSKGGIVNDTIINDWGEVDLESSGTANNTTVNAGGALLVYSKAKAIGTTVYGGMQVLSGGIASDTTVTGWMYVSEGGRITGSTTVNQGGTATFEGGVFTGIEVHGGKLNLKSSTESEDPDLCFFDKITVDSGGSMIVSAGGSASSATVNDASVTVRKDGILDYATLTNATVAVSSGAVVSRVDLKKGAVMNVTSGGTLQNIYVSAGAVLTGVLREASQLKFYDGTLDLDISTAAPGNEFLIDDASFSFIEGSYSYTLTVSASQADGAYNLIEDATGFDKTITVKDTLGTTLGTLMLGGDPLVYGTTSYTLGIDTTGLLTVTIGAGGGVDLTGNLTSKYDLEAGKYASDVKILEGGKLNVYKDALASQTTVNSGGTLFISEGGIASDTTLNDNGKFRVLGTASKTAIAAGGSMYVHGSADSATIAAGGRLVISSGGKISNITAELDGAMDIESGASATGIVAAKGARMTLRIAPNTYVQGTYDGNAFELKDAVLSGFTLKTSGVVNVLDGGVTSDVTVSGGLIRVYNGSVAKDTLVSAGGELMLREEGAVANGVTIKNGGKLTFSEAGGKLTGKVTIETGAIISVCDGAIVDFDLTKTTTADPALVNNLSFFGTAAVNYTLTVDGTEADGDYKLAEGAAGFDQTITVVNTSGTTLGTLMLGGDPLVYGTTSYTLGIDTTGLLTVTIGAGGGVDLTGDLTTEYHLTAGMVGSDVNILNGGFLHVEEDGKTSQTAVNSGGSMVVSQGGSASDTTVNNGGKLYVSKGGIASKTELNNGGKLFASGSVDGATVRADGSMFVSSGATVNDINVSSGGSLWLYDGTTATGIVVAKGAELYLNVALDTYVKGTYAENAFEMKDATLSDFTAWKKCTVAVRSGGVTSNIMLDEGYVWIYSDGVAKDTVVAGELGLRGAGAVASGVTFQAGGHLWINKAGGKLTGKVTFETGAGVTYSDGVSATLDFDLTQTTAGADALVNDLSFVLGAPFNYTLTVVGTEADGDYKLAEGAAGFDQTITVKDTLGTTLGTLTVAGGKTTLTDGRKYTLTLSTGGSLGLTLGEGGGGGGTSDITGDLNSDFELTAGMVGSSVNILEGGRLIVDGGGSADVVTVNSGGFLYVYNGGKATQIKENGGYVGVNDGATVTFVPNSFGGYVYDSPDEWATIHSGTTGTDLTVGNDGLIYVYSGGTAVDTTVAADGNLGVDDGGKLTGKVTIETGATVTAEAGAIFDFDITPCSPDNAALVDNLSAVMSQPFGFTLTVGGMQEAGNYALAENAAGFSESVHVSNTTGMYLGVLSVTGGAKTLADGREYTLTLSGSDLSITIGTLYPDFTPPTVDNVKADITTWTNKDVTVTADFLDNCAIAERRYKLAGDTDWTSYPDGGVVVSENTTVFFQAVDAMGFDSDEVSIVIDCIDKEAPTIAVTPGTTAITDTLTLKAEFNDNENVAATFYKLEGDTDWTPYPDSGVTVTENTTVSFMAYDDAGNETTAAYEVTNIGGGGGGATPDLTGDLTTTFDLNAGMVGSSVNILDGGDLDVYDGGSADVVTVNFGGDLWVWFGGKATLVKENGGYVFVNDGATVEFVKNSFDGYVYNGNDRATIHSGTTGTNLTAANEGRIYVFSGGTAVDTTVAADGIFYVSSGGTAVDTTVAADGLFYVSSGGTATGIVAEAGAYLMLMAAPGTYQKGTYAGNAFEIVENATDFTVHDKVALDVLSDGTAADTTVAAGGIFRVHSGGTATDTTVAADGHLEVWAGGTATGIVAVDGARLELTVASGTYQKGTYAGSAFEVADTVTDFTVHSGGDLYVSAGGSADVVTVNFGGDLFVSAGGTATLVKENGGYAGVQDGATVTFVPNSFGGYVYNNADDWCTIHDGTTGSNLTAANKGRIYVYSGGIASDTTVNDKGIVEGNSGGLIDGVVVNSGGSLLIYNGAKLTGQMTFVAGAEVIPFVGSILDFDLTQTAPDAAALVNDLSILMGTPGYTLTVDGTQATGTYKLAGNATGFSKIITVKSTLGEEYGYLTFGGTLSTSFANYTLALADDNTLTVDLVAKAPADTTPPVVSNIHADVTTPTNSNVTVTADFTDNVAVASRLFNIDDGEWQDYNPATGVVMTTNGTVNFKAIDTAGNESEGVNYYTVSNIDKVDPTIMNIMPSTSEYGVASVTVTAEFYDDVELASKQFRLGDGAWQDYDPAVGAFVTENTTVAFKATDAAGNETTESYEVTNIDTSVPDTTPPTITVTASTTEPVASLTVAAEFADNVGVVAKQYRVGDGDWKDYSDPIPVTENVTVGFRASDAAGNATAVSYDVTNIENEPENDWLFKKKKKTYVWNSEENINAFSVNEVAAGNSMVYLDKKGSVQSEDGTRFNSLSRTKTEAGTVEDAADYAKIELAYGAALSFRVDSTVGGTFYVYEAVDKNGSLVPKQKQKITVKANKTSPAKLTTIYLKAGEYFVGMEGSLPSKKKKSEYSAYYNVNLATKYFENADGGWNNSVYAVDEDTGKTDKTNLDAKLKAGALVLERGVTEIKLDEGAAGTDDWVGFCDATDYRMFTLGSKTNLTLSLSVAATETGKGKAKLTIWKVSTGKGGKITLSKKGSVEVKQGKTGLIKSKVLAKGDYFISVTSSSASKGGDVSYNVKVNDKTVFFDSSDGDAVNGYVYDKKKKLNPEIDNSAFRTNSITVSGSKELFLDSNEIKLADYSNFVGYNDKADYAKFNMASGGDVTFKIDTTGSGTFAIYRDNKAKNKLELVKKVEIKADKTTGEGHEALAVAGLSAEEDYFISMTAKSTKTNSSGSVFYKVWADAKLFAIDGSALAMPETSDSLAMADALSFGQYADADALANASASSLAELDGNTVRESIALLA